MSVEPPSPHAYLQTRRVHLHRPAVGNRFRHTIITLRRALADAFGAAELPADACVLDYGCAESPYRHLLPEGCRYVGADLPGTEAADLALLPDGRLPVEEARYDLVLSTQVLEHVADPALYLAECFRVLRPSRCHRARIGWQALRSADSSRRRRCAPARA